MVDGLRGYVQMAAGLGELTAARARELARGLMSGPGRGVPGGAPEAAASVAAVAEDLLATAKANRGLLMDLVRAEVERAVTGLGLVTRSEAAALQTRIERLEARLAEQQATGGSARRGTARPAQKTAKRAAAGPGAKSPSTRT